MTGIDMISQTSIMTTFPPLIDKSISCVPTLGSSSAIDCINIASILKATVYKVAFAFVIMDSRIP